MSGTGEADGAMADTPIGWVLASMIVPCQAQRPTLVLTLRPGEHVHVASRAGVYSVGRQRWCGGELTGAYGKKKKKKKKKKNSAAVSKKKKKPPKKKGTLKKRLNTRIIHKKPNIKHCIT
eukprot:NODE_15642_length_1039_cov_3.273026.p3 GENE.NODE_15642_length_1039_cov_3.273026~~NODE_15642_length_1039_cov_3.273026.p3  ORF type:complete len:120 (-),score=33.00 NODE_15642_length_1039_cov_3.273026:45-404(-)